MWLPDVQFSADTVDAVHVDERYPVDALLDAAGTFDLLLLGARGLHGLRALGSVSERVAHRASASSWSFGMPRDDHAPS